MMAGRAITQNMVDEISRRREAKRKDLGRRLKDDELDAIVNQVIDEHERAARGFTVH